jgi:hypothetical protein
MKSNLPWITLASLGLLACGKSNFKASSNTAPAKAVAVSNDAVSVNPETKTVEERADTIEAKTSSVPTPTPEPKVVSEEFSFPIGECVTKWGGGELIKNIAKNPKVVDLNKFISGDLLFEDKTVTTAPVFYLLNVNFDIAAHAQMYLKNPKGYYCVNIVAKSVRDFDIDVSCTTEVTTATRPGQYFNTLYINREMVCH